VFGQEIIGVAPKSLIYEFAFEKEINIEKMFDVLQKSVQRIT
jgi:hypothetical protein